MCRDCDDWMVTGRLRRREIRHDKSGPEEMPHRKKGGKKRVRSDHKHDYVVKEHRIPLWRGDDYIYYTKTCSVCGRRG